MNKSFSKTLCSAFILSILLSIPLFSSKSGDSSGSQAKSESSAPEKSEFQFYFAPPENDCSNVTKYMDFGYTSADSSSSNDYSSNQSSSSSSSSSSSCSNSSYDNYSESYSQYSSHEPSYIDDRKDSYYSTYNSSNDDYQPSTKVSSPSQTEPTTVHSCSVNSCQLVPKSETFLQLQPVSSQSQINELLTQNNDTKASKNSSGETDESTDAQDRSTGVHILEFEPTIVAPGVSKENAQELYDKACQRRDCQREIDQIIDNWKQNQRDANEHKRQEAEFNQRQLEKQISHGDRAKDRLFERQESEKQLNQSFSNNQSYSLTGGSTKKTATAMVDKSQSKDSKNQSSDCVQKAHLYAQFQTLVNAGPSLPDDSQDRLRVVDELELIKSILSASTLTQESVDQIVQTLLCDTAQILDNAILPDSEEGLSEDLLGGAIALSLSFKLGLKSVETGQALVQACSSICARSLLFKGLLGLVISQGPINQASVQDIGCSVRSASGLRITSKEIASCMKIAGEQISVKAHTAKEVVQKIAQHTAFELAKKYVVPVILTAVAIKTVAMAAKTETAANVIAASTTFLTGIYQTICQSVTTLGQKLGLISPALALAKGEQISIPESSGEPNSFDASDVGSAIGADALLEKLSQAPQKEILNLVKEIKEAATGNDRKKERELRSIDVWLN